MSKIILKANSSITTDEVESFKQNLENGLEKTNTVVVDFSETKLICSSGIGVLISALKAAKQKGGAIDLIIPQSNVEITQIFNITRLNKVFNIFNSAAEYGN